MTGKGKARVFLSLVDRGNLVVQLRLHFVVTGWEFIRLHFVVTGWEFIHRLVRHHSDIVRDYPSTNRAGVYARKVANTVGEMAGSIGMIKR